MFYHRYDTQKLNETHFLKFEFDLSLKYQDIWLIGELKHRSNLRKTAKNFSCKFFWRINEIPELCVKLSCPSGDYNYVPIQSLERYGRIRILFAAAAADAWDGKENILSSFFTEILI